MLKNAPTLAIVAVHTAENEPSSPALPAEVQVQNNSITCTHYLEPSSSPLITLEIRIQ